MRVLVTGASGYVGGGAARALIAAGHEVEGLVRDPDRAAALPEGVRPVVGDLADPMGLAAAVAGVDGVVHAASSNDGRAGELDRAAVTAILGALAGSGRLFVYTSGIWLHGDSGDEPLTEDSPLRPPAAVSGRPAIEEIVRAAAGDGVRSTIIRPAQVYGNGGGYVPLVLAPRDGVVRHFGDGANHWTVVHVDDLGDLYRLAIERAPAGAVYLGTLDEPVRVRDAAQAVAEAAGARVAAWPPAEAEGTWGAFVEAFMLDQRASGGRARRELGWSPSRDGLLEDLRRTRHPLPARPGPRPETSRPRPHAQASQCAKPRLQRALAERALALPGVRRAKSLVSLPDAIAFVLDEAAAGGPPEAFQAGREFAHVHPEHDGSLHMTLPAALAAEAYAAGWGEPHPVAGTPLIFGPRDEGELEVVWRLLRSSYDFAGRG